TVVRGGSTITQQLAGGLFLTRERTWWRKAREIGIALVLEARYSKAQILEAYLNTVYLGQERGAAVLGVGAGARHLFGKNLESLRLDEAALLAAAIRAPSGIVAEATRVFRTRRDGVLETMVKDGAASEADARAAMTRPTRPTERATAQAPWFMEVVRGEVAQRGGDALGGVTLVTSLDRRLQDSAGAAVAGGRGPRAARRPHRAHAPRRA